MFKVYDGDKLIDTVANIQEFIMKGYPASTARAEDAKGYAYYLDGTGIGFRACRILHKDLVRKPFYTRGIYAQDKCKFEHILANAREIKDRFGLEESIKYLNRLRKLRG